MFSKQSVRLTTISCFMVLFVLTTVNSFASTRKPGLAAESSYSANQAENFNAIVKLTPEMATVAEASLNDKLEITPDAPGQMAEFLQKYAIRRMVPLHKNIVSWKKQTGKSESEYIELMQQRNPRRAKRGRKNAENPELSQTYVMELEVKSWPEFEAVLALLKKDSGLEYVERDQELKIQAMPDDPYYHSKGSWKQSYDDLYGIKEISCPQAWDLSTGKGVIVAVIDSGVDQNHPDLSANMWINDVVDLRTNSKEIPNNNIDDDGNGFIDDMCGWDFVYNTNLPLDDHGHGTHVAGTISAVGNNGTGVIGVAPEAKIMPLKCINEDGLAREVDIYKSIIYAVDNGADIINLSLGLPGKPRPIEEAIKYAYGQGVVVIVSAGNEMGDDVKKSYPAGCHDVITVSALDAANRLTDFSNIGGEVDVAAPGEDILSLRADGTFMGDPEGDLYTRADGTSMAAPHVAGVAALVLALYPEYSCEQVRQAICSSTDDILAPGKDAESGYGKLNAFNAVSASEPLEVHLRQFPSNDAMKGWVPFVGTVKGTNLSGYTLEYGPGVNPANWTTLAQGSAAVEEKKLGVLNTTTLPDGIYTFRLVASDHSGKRFYDYLETTVRYANIYFPAPPASDEAAHQMRSGDALNISGRANRPSFQQFKLEWGEGLNPTGWYTTGFELMGKGYTRVDNGRLAKWDSSVVTNKTGYYTIRLTVVNAGFSDVTSTCVYLEPDLAGAQWPQKLNAAPSNNVMPWQDGSGKTRLILNLFDPYEYGPSSFYQCASDGSTQNETQFTRAFNGQLAVGNLDGRPGDEAVFIRDGSYIRIVKPDQSFEEFAPDLSRLTFQNTPVVIQDLDGDTVPEILAVGSDRQRNDAKYLFAIKPDGKLDSRFEPIFIRDREKASFAPKVRFLAVNLDQEPAKEILVVQGEAKNTSTLKVYGSDGRPRNWQVEPDFGQSLIVNLAAGDLDHDGSVELVVTTFQQDVLNNGRLTYDFMRGAVYLIGADGKVKPGWPVQLPFFWMTYIPDVGLADLDRDGDSEIIVSTSDNISALRLDGKPFSSSWPFEPKGVSLSNFSIGDLNGDMIPEILIVTHSIENEVAGLMALDSQANIIKSWTLPGINGQKAVATKSEPLLGDFDGNGKVDIALSFELENKQGGLTVLTLDAPYNPQYMDWPMIFHDPQNTSIQTESRN